ncbi:MAG: uroporphyrinogen-III C-methyltransferase [Gammaproteobacteria bacterium]|nr:uroporphyrinogen-III C-methyltransferase [Gammaproteobacteria bacterium]
MAENNEQNKTADTINSPELSVNDKTARSSNKVLIGLIVVLIIASGLVWLCLQQIKLNDAIDAKVSSLDVSLLAKDEKVLALENANSQLNQHLSELVEQQKLLSQKMDVLSDSQTLTDADVKQFWTLSEVEYLLNIANQRVALASDIIGAQAALTMADDLVKNLNEHRLSPLRERIAQEQLALASVVKPDVEGIAFKLRSAINAVDRLHVLMAAPVSETEQELSMLDVNDWNGIASSAWQQIKSLVVIRHQQDGSAAVLVPEQRYFLYQNLKLKLETAQLALLSGKSSVFESSLASAADWLTMYFVGDKRDAMLAMIRQLQSENISVELPDISGSATWLKGFE